MTVTVGPFKFKKGDTKHYQFKLFRKSGGAFDLTDNEIRLSVKRVKTDTAYVFQLRNTLAGGGDTQIEVVAPPTNGILKAHILPTLTSVLRGTGDHYIFDLEVKKTTEVYTPVEGEMFITDDVTIL